MRAGEMNGAVERHDGLSGAGRARDAGRAAVCVPHDPALRRMQEDRPLLPRELERALQLVGVLHEAEAALRVRVRERVRVGGHSCRALRRAAGGKLQQRLRRLGRQVVGEIEQRVLVRAANVVQPRLGDAVAQQLVVRGFGEERWLGRGRRSGGGCLHDDGARDFDLAHGLTDLDDLGHAGPGMPLDPPPLCPSVRGIVMVDIGEKDARCRPMHDQADVPADPDRPEVPILCPIQLVKRVPGPRRIHLQIEGRGLHGLLLVARQLGEAPGEGISNTELHSRLTAGHREVRLNQDVILK